MEDLETAGHSMAGTTSLRDWIFIFPRCMKDDVKKFVEMFREAGRDIGFDISDPELVDLACDRSHIYTQFLRGKCIQINANFVMAVVRRQRADAYGAIKKLTCSDLGIPTQVITERILNATSGKMKPLATEVMIQVAAKLGAEPRDQVPKEDWMVCGYD